MPFVIISLFIGPPAASYMGHQVEADALNVGSSHSKPNYET